MAGDGNSSQAEDETPLHDKDHYLKMIGNNLTTPRHIQSFLDQYVIGQNEAKKTLSVAIYNHYRRILYQESTFQESSILQEDKSALQSEQNEGLKRDGTEEKVEIEKSNILLLGPSGSGKNIVG